VDIEFGRSICVGKLLENKNVDSSPSTRHGGAWGREGIAPTHSRPRH
jgi:hypothetical protein